MEGTSGNLKSKPVHQIGVTPEFYGIMDRGGFNVIVGNPPYVEYSKMVKTYKIKGYTTKSCSNLYAFVLERNTGLIASRGRSGMIVPHSAICTDRMGPVQKFLVSKKDTMFWVSSYDIRPAKLFVGVDQRLAIYLTAGKVSDAESGILSSRYHRWSEQFRTVLLSSIEYVNTTISIIPYSVPKIYSLIEEQLLEKLISNQILKQSFQQSFQRRYSLRSKGSTIYFHNAPRYWIRATDFIPYFWNERDGEKISTQVKSLTLTEKSNAAAVVAVLNSSLFYWWFLILSDCRHLNMREIESFPLGLDQMPQDTKVWLGELTDRLMENFNRHKQRKETQYQTTGKVVYDEFNQKPSKSIIDEIDQALAKHFDFTDEELDFIINYDVKYRMGQDSEK